MRLKTSPYLFIASEVNSSSKKSMRPSPCICMFLLWHLFFQANCTGGGGVHMTA